MKKKEDDFSFSLTNGPVIQAVSGSYRDRAIANSRKMAVSSARQDWSEVLDSVRVFRERLILTRNNRPVAAIIPIDDLERLIARDEAVDKELMKGEVTQTVPDHAKTLDEVLRSSKSAAEKTPAPAAETPAAGEEVSVRDLLLAAIREPTVMDDMAELLAMGAGKAFADRPDLLRRLKRDLHRAPVETVRDRKITLAD